VLDARTAAAPCAVVPLWPEALRRIPAFADLHLLDELARLLDGAVRVVRCAPTAAAAARAPLWSLIAPSSRARAQWIAEYAAAAAAIARERGWPGEDDVARPLVRVA
jgi:hypothetical protein